MAFLLAAAGISSGAFAFVSNYWQADANGNWSGNYSDANHWSLGHLPNKDVSSGEDAIIRSQDFDFTVTMDVTPGCESSAVRFEIPDAQQATLAPRTAFTYGADPTAGTPATEAADRAFTLGYRSTLTLACADPDEPTTPRAIRFTDPIVGHAGARLVKTGAGTLTLASDGNTLTNTAVVVQSGDLAWTADQEFGSLAVAADGRLAYAKAGDGIPALTVNSDVDLDGVTIDPADAETRTFATQAKTLLAVPAGCRITGTPHSKYNTRFKVLTDPETGAMSLTVRTGQSMALIVR